MVLVDVVDLVCAFCSRHDSVFLSKDNGFLAKWRMSGVKFGRIPQNPPETLRFFTFQMLLSGSVGLQIRLNQFFVIKLIFP